VDPREPSTVEREALEALYDQGQVLAIHGRFADFSPPATWSGLDNLLFASRLAVRLGDAGLSHRLDLRVLRRYPRRLDGRALHVAMTAEHRDPGAAWALARGVTPDPTEPDSAQGRWFSTVARVLIELRDFERAAELLGRAPPSPWVAFARAHLFERSDRYAEALAVASSVEDPGFARGRAQVVAHVLSITNRRPEAIATLEEVTRRGDFGDLHWFVATLYEEERRYDEAWAALAAFERCSPWLDAPTRANLAARRSDVAYLRGDRALAIAEAERADAPFFTALRARLAAAPVDAPRRILDVEFVRQHHLTCAPATLTALARYFEAPTDHLEVAEAICYDGTPAHSARAWAEGRGWTAREFTVDFASTKQLVDAGLPFLLSTVATASAHAQAVVGYDDARGTLFLRDPFVPVLLEVAHEGLFDGQRSTGPRGLVVVPEGRGITVPRLPDDTLWDRLHELHLALRAHARDRAVELSASLAGEPIFADRATLALGSYDDDFEALAGVFERMLARWPEAAWARFGLVRVLRRVDIQKAEAALAVACEGDHDPLFDEVRAADALEDVRRRHEVQRWLGASIGARPDRGPGYALRARLFRGLGDHGRALDELRFASCLEPTDEALALDYFHTAHALGQTEVGLQHLKARTAATGRRSAGPHLTLARAYDLVDDGPRATAVVDELLALRPDDADARCAVAVALVDRGELDRARALLAEVEGKAHRVTHLRAVARLARREGDLERAAEALCEILTVNPLDEAHEALVETWVHGDQLSRAIEHLDATLSRFPHQRRLLVLRAQLLREHHHPRALEVLDALIADDPTNGWALRERAIALSDLGRLADAEAACAAASVVAPDHPSLHHLRSLLGQLAGDVEGTRAALSRVLAIDPDAAVRVAYLQTFPALERSERLRAMVDEVVARSVSGDAIHTWFELAVKNGLATEARVFAERALEERPELFLAGSIALRARLQAGELDAAEALATAMLRRFPHVPRAWVDAAQVAAQRGDPAAEIERLERAVAQSPGYDVAVERLAQALVATGQRPRAKAVLEQGLRFSPGSLTLLDLRSRLFFQDDDAAGAIRFAETFVRRQPTEIGVWASLHRWKKGAGEPEGAIPLARLEHARGPAHARHGMPLARLLVDDGKADEALQVLSAMPHVGHGRLAVQRLRARAHELRGDHAAAIEACLGADGGPEPRLAVLAAQLHEAHGEWTEAWDVIERSLSVEANDAELLQAACDLAPRVGRSAEAATFARRLVTAHPEDEVSHGHLAGALLAVGDREAARAAFVEAHRMAPGYVWAARQLLVLERVRSTPAAEALLARVAPHLEPDDARTQALQIALDRGDEATIEAVLSELVVKPGDAAPLLVALRICALHGRANLGFEIMTRLVGRTDTRGAAGEWWAQTARRRKVTIPSPFARPVEHLAAQGMARVGLRRQAEYGLLHAFTWVAFAHRRWLRSDPSSVEVVVAGFHSARAWLRLLAWSAGLAPSDLTPEARWRKAAAFRELGLLRRAAILHRAGLDDPGGCGPWHRILLAYELCGTSAVAEVDELLAPLAKEQRSELSFYADAAERIASLRHNIAPGAGQVAFTAITASFGSGTRAAMSIAEKIVWRGRSVSALLPQAYPFSSTGLVLALVFVVMGYTEQAPIFFRLAEVLVAGVALALLTPRALRVL